MCAAVTQFANASTDAEAHSVVLTTDWGSQRLVEKNLIFEKHCEHYGYEPGAQLCGYLMENTSTEFSTINFRRAMACLGADVSANGVNIEWLEGRLSSSS